MVNTTAARSVVANQIEDNANNQISASDVRQPLYLILDELDKTDGGIPNVLDYNANGNNGAEDAAFAITTAAAAGVYRFPPGVYRIASNITLTGYIYIMPGARLRPTSGVTVTIAGLIIAGAHRIFDTSQGGGFVAATSLQTSVPTTEAYPEWWGATGTSVNCSPLIQAALNFLQNGSGGTLRLNGWYRCDQTLLITGRVAIVGSGPVYGTSLGDGGIERTTTLDFSAAPANVGAFLVQNGSDTVNGFRLENIGMFRSPVEATNATSVGLSLVAVQKAIVEHITIYGFGAGIQVNDNVNASTKAGYDCTFRSCTVHGTRSAMIVGGCAGYTFSDCIFWSEQPSLAQLILIGRGIGGMKADTLTLQDCRIHYLSANFAGRPQVLVRITDGMWLNFCRVGFEEAAEAGVLIQRDATASHSDLSLKNVDIDNCWFNGVGRNVVFSGFRANGQVRGCRMENASGGTSCIAIEFSTPVAADITILGNTITNSGTTGGIAVSNVSEIGIIGNRIRGTGGGVSAPGIVLTTSVSDCTVSANRVASNHAGPISNSGSNNQVTGNALKGV